ncbi:MAG TPA: ATP-binding protein, partial [Gaiellaceae bacterium]|nr:ATP-binding protein [Gaiellaceae bacterium]
FESVPDGRVALRRALEGGRFVRTLQDGKTFVVGLRLRRPGGAIVTFTARPELRAELGIVRDQIVTAALVAVAVGALVGLLIAALIAARLRRIAGTAAAIEAGAFDRPLQPLMRDEVGELASTIDRMRTHLRDSFGRLEAERDRLRQLLEGLHEGVVAIDPELRIAFANRAARPLLELHGPGAGAELPEPWPDFPLRQFAARLFLDDAKVAQSRVVAGERTFALIGIPARRGATDAIVVVSDISERERRERAEREFVANAAHELGTPLTAIATSLEVLQSGVKDDPAERDQFLALIERQTARLSRLRRALLSLARAQTRQETLHLEPVELRPLLERVVEEVAPLAGDVGVEVDAPEGMAVLAQRELLEHVLVNLVENALRHAGAGVVRLIGVALASGFAAVEVRDDGRGIPPAVRERLFDRFYRGEGDGFGLGLAIARDAVRALGGTIDARPGAERGTVFRITLAQAVPVARDA